MHNYGIGSYTRNSLYTHEKSILFPDFNLDLNNLNSFYIQD